MRNRKRHLDSFKIVVLLCLNLDQRFFRSSGTLKGKDNTKIKYSRSVAGRRLTKGSIVNNLKLEEMLTQNTKASAKV